MPFISIIIPTLNEEKYLPPLLKDLTLQTNLDFEVIVVDAHSPDKTAEYASKFATKLPHFTLLNSAKRNVSYQRNIGAKMAKGQYLLFMDADNRLPHYYLEGIRYRLHKNTPELFTTWCVADTHLNSDKAVANVMNISLEAAKMIDNPYAYGALIGCTKKLFQSTAGFDETMKFSEDVEFVFRCSKNGFKLHIFKDPCYILSLRRFRKLGKLKTLQKGALLTLKTFTNIRFDQQKEYPMGGSEYITPKLQKTFTSVSNKPKILEKIKTLIDSLDE